MRESNPRIPDRKSGVLTTSPMPDNWRLRDASLVSGIIPQKYTAIAFLIALLKVELYL